MKAIKMLCTGVQ